jgi:hypothetical protein
MFDMLGSFEFLLGMVIWHDICFAVNMVSKKLKSATMCIDSTLQKIEGVIDFFAKYRNNGFASSLYIARHIALDMKIKPSFPVKRRASRKKTI